MTVQPQKFCGVHQKEGNRQGGSEEALWSGRAARICCSYRGRACQKGQPNDRHVTTEEAQCTGVQLDIAIDILSIFSL